MASHNSAGSMWSKTPSSYTKFENHKENLSGLISHEENKFFAVKALYTLAVLQIIFGTMILIAQVSLNKVVLNDIPCGMLDNVTGSGLEKSCTFMHSGVIGIWCGCVIVLTGILSALTTHFKSNTLLVVSGFLNVVLYGVSIFLFVAGMVNSVSEFHAPGFEIYRNGYAAMAIIAAVNFVVSILTSALFCRAGCSCCQPRAPIIMYLTETAGVDRPSQLDNGNMA